MRSRALSTRHQELAPLKQPVGAKELPQSRRVHVPNALTCTFAPLAGLEPAPYGLEVRHELSGWCSLGASSQVESGVSSGRFHPDRGCYNDRIARWIATHAALPCGLAQLRLQVVADYSCAGSLRS